VFAAVGPSGAGKETLMAEVAHRRPDPYLVRRVVTRPPEAGGERFDAVSPADFARRRVAGDFTLDWTAHGLGYGIPREAAAARRAGRGMIFNGLRAVLGRGGEIFNGLQVIHVAAAPEVLAGRLVLRARKSRRHRPPPRARGRRPADRAARASGSE
jgi:ribose 1,5-bisphosphokinase